MHQIISTVEDVTRLGEDIARPLKRKVLRNRAESVIDTAWGESSEVDINIEIVESDKLRKNWLTHIIIESLVNPALLEEARSDLNKVVAVGERRFLLSS